ncbi:hypothetical protein LHK_01299 [Laribacter hongkongensis HLHK9]|uniref:Uncharacterized protein n=1 Tax=Laribacter hongkongensis (strain HLHK9) TaxID=557598 RepID=C1D749_LARHH|nr:hypothetical protein LHK_01299 [Laribacter hongkongensis HLHK9]
MRCGHHGLDVGFDSSKIKAVESLGVVKSRCERTGRRVVGTQRGQVELVRPPVLVGGHGAGSHGCCAGIGSLRCGSKSDRQCDHKGDGLHSHNRNPLVFLGKRMESMEQSL